MMSEIIIAALVIINLISFFAIWIDKRKAVRKKWRIPEKVFFYLAAAGGCPGIYIGIFGFRHKTKKWYFRYFIPLIFAIHVTVAIFVVHQLL